MKFSISHSVRLLLWSGIVSILPPLTLAAPITLELASEVQGADTEGRSAFILELARASLGNREEVELVDRTRMKEALDELGLAAAGVSSSPSEMQKLGKLVGAQYLCHARTIQSGDNQLISVRVIQVGTSVYKMAIIQAKKDDDLGASGTLLANKILGQIAKLEKRPELEKPVPEAAKIPENQERPVVALRLLESALNVRSVDPASEIRLLKHLKVSKFQSIQLSQRGQSVRRGENKILEGKAFDELIEEAKAQNVEVLILGEACSETAGRIGRIVYSRARVEVHCIRVSDQVVLHTASAYGAHSDIADLVAGKKAIEDATDKMCLRLPADLANAWDAKSQKR